MESRVSWKEKMEHPAAPIVKLAPSDWVSRYQGNRMLIPTPKEIERMISSIRKGKVMTIGELRSKLAAEFDADFSCPLTTGIFLRIVAEYAEELKAEGKKRFPAYWRIVRDDGSLIENFPGGAKQQYKYLKEDGVDVITKGKHSMKVRSFVKE